jgi:hypothetical protein
LSTVAASLLLLLTLLCVSVAQAATAAATIEAGQAAVMRVWAEGVPTSVCWLARPAEAGSPPLAPSYPECDLHCGVHILDADPHTPGYLPPGDVADLVPVQENCVFEKVFDVAGDWYIGVTVQYLHEDALGAVPYETTTGWRVFIETGELFADDFDGGDTSRWSGSDGSEP